MSRIVISEKKIKTLDFIKEIVNQERKTTLHHKIEGVFSLGGVTTMKIVSLQKRFLNINVCSLV